MNSWNTLSLAAQMANIGSEVSRAARAEKEHPERLAGAIARGLDLFDRTLSDERWKGRRDEIARGREVFCDAALGGKSYGTTFANFQRYFDIFATAKEPLSF